MIVSPHWQDQRAPTPRRRMDRARQLRGGAVAALELVMVAPLLVLMWLAVFEFGRAGDAAIEVAVQARAETFMQRNGVSGSGSPLRWPGDITADLARGAAERSISSSGPIGALGAVASRSATLRGTWDYREEPLDNAPHFPLVFSLVGQIPNAGISTLEGNIAGLRARARNQARELSSTARDQLAQFESNKSREETARDREQQQRVAKEEANLRNLDNSKIPGFKRQLDELDRQAVKLTLVGIERLQEVEEEKEKQEEDSGGEKGEDGTDNQEDSKERNEQVPAADEVQQAYEQVRADEARRQFGKPIPGLSADATTSIMEARRLLEKVDPELLEVAQAWGEQRAALEVAEALAKTLRENLRRSSTL